MGNLKHHKKIPALPGVYFFKDSSGKTIYIGKATNLRSRISSYFNKATALSAAKSAMLEKITALEWRVTDSEIEALVMEARLIKKHRPKYNVALRDDKNYFFVGITKEEWPRVFLTHQPSENQKSIRQLADKNQNFIGPFTDGKAIKATLKLLRKVFPFKTCKNPVSKSCFYRHLGLCPAHDSKPLARKKYRSDLKNLIAVLKGKKQSVLKGLRTKMKQTAKKQDFEKAALLRDQLFSLERVFNHRRVISEYDEYGAKEKEEAYAQIQNELKKLLGITAEVRRIECFDISHIQGRHSVGSMVVFSAESGENFTSKKSEYRKFKIKTVMTIDDPAMLAEVLERRLAHKEWPLPQLIVLDGGKGQLSAGVAVLKKLRLKIPICALAKKEEELYVPRSKKPIVLKTMPQDVRFLFQRIRDEAHRFAISFHLKLRSSSFSTHI